MAEEALPKSRRRKNSSLAALDATAVVFLDLIDASPFVSSFIQDGAFSIAASMLTDSCSCFSDVLECFRVQLQVPTSGLRIFLLLMFVGAQQHFATERS